MGWALRRWYKAALISDKENWNIRLVGAEFAEENGATMNFLKERIWFSPLWAAFTTPNLQLLYDAFKRIQESGIFEFWNNYHEYDGVAYRPFFTTHKLTEFLVDAKAKRERERISTFENSVLKSSFYLYGAGVGVSLSLVFCRLTWWLLQFLIVSTIFCLRKFRDYSCG